MKQITKQFGKLVLGLFFISLATFLNSCLGLGFQSWNVLNDGISKVFSITFGQANFIVGILILIIDLISGEQLGLGTFLNIALVGIMVDILLLINDRYYIIPNYNSMFYKLVLCSIAALISVIGIYLYMSVGMGAGPRDCLMVAVAKQTRFSVGTCRLMLDAGVLVIGWIMGGVVGIGTLIMTITKGPGLQLLCKVVECDIEAIRNESIAETLENIRSVLKKRNM